MTFSWWHKWGGTNAEGNEAHYIYTSNTTDPKWFRAGLTGSANAPSLYASYRDSSSVGQMDLRTNAVFRDPSAWYHFVIIIDTTQATASDRVKLYVNGEQVTSFSTATYPSLNYTFEGVITTSGNAVNLGRSFVNSTALHPIEAYITEYHHVDGQALTPSDFGETDTTTGIWKPKRYTGTYGTNGFYLPFTEKTDFKSFDLDGTGDYISAPASEYSNYINGSGNFTIEWWANYDALPSDAGWYAQDSGSAVVSPFNLFQQTNSWRLYATTANGVWNVFSNTLLATTSLTTGRWYHIACVRNGSTLTLYVDGVSQGSQSIGTASLWQDTSHNLSLFNDWQSAGGSGGFNGRVSNYRLVKGTAVYTGNFTPPTANLENISGTTILLARSTSTADLSGNITTTANGNLSLSDNNPPLSSGIGDDTSGNDNHWASNNIDLTSNATTYDIMNDVPTLTDEDTANFATLNPVNVSGGSSTITDGNLSCSAGSVTTYGKILGSIGISTGKWYWETTITAVGSIANVGLSNGSLPSGSYGLGGASGEVAYQSNGNKYVSGTATAYGSSYTTNDIIGGAYDADAGSITFYKNNVSQGAITGFSGIKFPAVGSGGGTNPQYALNFGQRPFAYTPPTGYKKLNTYNLPDSTIVDGSQYMNTVLYTGNGSTQSITGVGFQPDLVWYKQRNTARDNGLEDSVRGAQKILISNATNAEVSASGITSFDSDGFTQGSNVIGNQSGGTYVGWSWRGSDSTAVSNTDGTITSTVSANTTSGFSVVTYVGTAAIATVGHGLGVAPSMIITKNRDTTTAWWVYHAALGNTKYVVLNTTAAAVTSSVAWNNTSPTSTVFTLGGAGNPSNANQDVAYCFADVEGFSKFGSYTGNGSTDGPFVYTGFRPAFVMIKYTTAGASDWMIYDSARDPYNVIPDYLRSNLSNAETTKTGGWIDFISNGFKVRNTDATTASINFTSAGGTYIYMAFAENPFKQSLAR